MDEKQIGRRVKARRVARGWNKSELARKAGVSPSYVSKLEAGTYGSSSLNQMAKIATALGCDLDDLVTPSAAELETASRLHAELMLLGYDAEEAPVVDEAMSKLLQRTPDQRRQIIAILRTLAEHPPG